MRSVKLTDMNSNIEKNKKNINRMIQKYRPEKMINRKTRSETKQKLLTEITTASISNAKKSGKFKVLGHRRIYYDPTI